MINTWLTEDHRIHLPKLFGHLGYIRSVSEKTHGIYTRKKETCAVILTDDGYRFYKVQRPEEKLSASNLIIEHVSKMEGADKETIWDKIDVFYRKVLETQNLLVGTENPDMEKVAKDFNHFRTYPLALSGGRQNLYDDMEEIKPFQDRIFEDQEGKVLFPLYNLQNENCGFFVDTAEGMTNYKESAMKNSLWYSNIPDTIDWLLVFKDPREALAFHKKFRLKNAVYLALGAINYETSKILFQIKRSTKVKKIILTFTGNKKIEGYLRDLNFISFMDESNFDLTVKEQDILVRFRMGEEKSFLNFFNSTKKFNQGLAKGFLKYSKVIDQNRINAQSIMVAKPDEQVKVRIPLEVNAIKFFVWSYYKNYLNKTIDILKPVRPNWYLEWESTQSISQKGREVHWKEYRIAL